MSARAIRALRSSADPLLPSHDDEDESDSDDEPTARPGRPTFAAFDDDDSSSESSHDDDDESEPEDAVLTSAKPPVVSVDDEAEKEVDEDLDALISEFQSQDTEAVPAARKQLAARVSPYSSLVQNLDVRDLDMEQSLRLALLEGLHDEDSTAQLPASRNHNNKRLFFFGPSREQWPKPPSLVGGGMGIKSYAETGQMMPWPYSSEADPSRWFQIVYSDDYQRDARDFEYIENSGDANALVQFVCHHPYHCAALLQLSHVLYQTDRSQQGLSLLRRCLWVLESSFGYTLAREHFQGNLAFMDATLETNQTFFQAVSKLMQVAYIAG